MCRIAHHDGFFVLHAAGLVEGAKLKVTPPKTIR